ncbi:unnamed protein product [Protopolystoma xenopodis]|uniref:Uncharacterized protein n=1 Tax=Protopolystoma xenopodis TaxID=117903 RepID=A0A3S5CPQ6_9PLAT|nr:unnamed protein product [Protopolystoma xenopodis]
MTKLVQGHQIPIGRRSTGDTSFPHKESSDDYDEPDPIIRLRPRYNHALGPYTKDPIRKFQKRSRGRPRKMRRGILDIQPSTGEQLPNSQTSESTSTEPVTIVIDDSDEENDVILLDDYIDGPPTKRRTLRSSFEHSNSLSADVNMPVWVSNILYT